MTAKERRQMRRLEIRAEEVKEWKYFEYEQCPRCESDLEIYSSEPVGVAWDGDKIRCGKCEFTSIVSVDGEEIWVHKMCRVGG